MIYEIVIKPQAEVDLFESTQWYETQKKGLGIRFLESVEEKMKLIGENPLKYQIRYRTVRFALIQRFLFAIHFVVEDRKIFVLAVLSTHRNPRIWE